MHQFDLNLLNTLNVLLEEGSVTGAAEKLNLSAPAVSRALTRIREMVGDPILVRAGRKLVPTARAEQLRPQVRRLINEAREMLTPPNLAPSHIERTFTVRAMDAVAAIVGPPLSARLTSQAPHVKLRFVAQGNEEVDALREAQIDLDIGVIDDTGPEIRRQTLYREKMVGVARCGHPIFSSATGKQVDVADFARYGHIVVSRRLSPAGPIDKALEACGLKRQVVLIVQHVNAGLLATASSDLITVCGNYIAQRAKRLQLPIQIFDLPVVVPTVPISIAWHPRHDQHPEHIWFREHAREVIGQIMSEGTSGSGGRFVCFHESDKLGGVAEQGERRNT